MRVAITGANGLVGSRLCDRLARREHDVLGLSRGALRVRAQGWTFAGIELTDPSSLQAALRAFRPEVIVNCASMTDVDGCERAPREAHAANATVPALLASEAAEQSAHIVQVSTDYVFDGMAGPYSEGDLPNPQGVYALTKLIGELAVRALCPSWAIARTAVVYGWPPAGRPNFGAWLVKALSARQPVRLFEDQFVSPSLALNVAEMLGEIAEGRRSGIWHTCGADVMNRVDYARAICARFDFDFGLVAPTRLADAKLASPRPLRSGLRVDRALRELELRPLGIEEALGRFFAEWRSSGAAGA